MFDDKMNEKSENGLKFDIHSWYDHTYSIPIYFGYPTS